MATGPKATPLGTTAAMQMTVVMQMTAAMRRLDKGFDARQSGIADAVAIARDGDDGSIGIPVVVDAYRGYLSSWVPQAAVMANRRDWGGGGDDPEESTQRMIERIWESLTEIRMRMD
ncbi:hypothetical protein Taro_033914 [Colocasia esculenta]|uniref:Uncharacterized protein n=1 Tax=Colocasia esculenta TaxID=4460 RepID=A0A843VZ94_COLES|nr:hypothetical protein [Colocasia esculenta]